jgi:hypothetical protein
VRKCSSLLLCILFAKISSSSVTSLPEIVSLSIFHGIAANLQLTFQEIKTNNRYWIIQNFSALPGIFLGKENKIFIPDTCQKLW